MVAVHRFPETNPRYASDDDLSTENCDLSLRSPQGGGGHFAGDSLATPEIPKAQSAIRSNHNTTHGRIHLLCASLCVTMQER